MGDGRAKGSSATEGGGQDAFSLIPDYIDGMSSGSLLCSILSAVLLLDMLGLK